MPIYTCLCEDEYHWNNCSNDCDLCSYAEEKTTEHVDCDCAECSLSDEYWNTDQPF